MDNPEEGQYKTTNRARTVRHVLRVTQAPLVCLVSVLKRFWDAFFFKKKRAGGYISWQARQDGKWKGGKGKRERGAALGAASRASFVGRQGMS